jgi:hypothetical protein
MIPNTANRLWIASASLATMMGLVGIAGELLQLTGQMRDWRNYLSQQFCSACRTGAFMTAQRRRA